MTIRTLHITNHYHENSGGIRTMLHAMLQTADEREMPLILVVPSSRDGVEDVRRRGRIYRVRARRSPFIDHRYRLLTPASIFLPQSSIWRILEAEKPDLIAISDKYVIHYLGGLIRKNWSPLGFRPTIVGISCERMDDNIRIYLPTMPLRCRLVAWYLGFIYIPQFDALIANSAYTAEELKSAMVPRHWRPLEIATPGVDAVTFHPSGRSEKARAELHNHLGFPKSCRLLVYAGRLSPEKNPMLLMDTLDALAQRRAGDYRMLVIGNGPSRSFMELRAARSLRGKVFFMNHLANRAQLARLLANCDVYVHPNPCEPFGIGPLEAMACRLPVVLPNRGGVLTYANNLNSWPSPPHATDFAQSVLDVFGSPERSSQRTFAARRTAEEFCWEKVLAGLFKQFEHLHEQRVRSLSLCPKESCLQSMMKEI
jgi:alpha-1,6-mannosyltransferase